MYGAVKHIDKKAKFKSKLKIYTHLLLYVYVCGSHVQRFRIQDNLKGLVLSFSHEGISLEVIRFGGKFLYHGGVH